MGVEKASFHILVNLDYRGTTQQVRTDTVSSSGPELLKIVFSTDCFFF